MFKIVTTTLVLMLSTTVVFADSTVKSLNDRLTALESKSINMPDGLYLNGEFFAVT